jgi:predicted AAA+ superfamily ATPase
LDNTNPNYRRFADARLIEALADTPVVLLHGPRQCGKTTLAKAVGSVRGYRYLSFDDPAVLATATADPTGFIDDGGDRVILDEVQRAPGLFLAIKSAVDRDRRPGRFLLTGSSNVLLVPTLADSLAGRMGILRLHPLAQAELAGRETGFLDLLFGDGFRGFSCERLRHTLATRVAGGGYPAALARDVPSRRASWYRDYIETLVQRDVRDLTRISSFEVLPRLLALAASQTARLINVSDLAAPFHLTRPTIRDYVTLLERLFLVEELPSWHTNRLSRLVKGSKLHLTDTGVACGLLDLEADGLWNDRGTFGQLLETFVLQELRREASWLPASVRFYHFRAKDGYEVDIVAERGGGRIAGIEVKAAASVAASDFRGLRKLAEGAGDRFVRGVVLYDGEATRSFGDHFSAVPVSALWTPPR